MVAPDRQFFDIGHGFAGLGAELAQGAVVVQAQHGGEVLAWQVRRALHGDVSVGVGGVAHHQHAHVAAGHCVQGLALCGKDFGVDGEQLSALHARAARARTNQQSVVHVFESGHGVAVRFHAHQQRECTVLQFHHHALQGLLGFFNRNFEQAQHHRLVFAQHFARGDAKQNGVTDLTCCAGNGNADGLLAHKKTPGSVVKA